MAEGKATKADELARLEVELKRLKSTRPEHCYGQEGFISTHAAKPEHLQKIEDLEDRIQALKAELARPA